LNIKKIIFSSENNEFEIHKPIDYHTDHVSNGNRYLQTILANHTNSKKEMRHVTPKCAKPPKQRPKGKTN